MPTTSILTSNSRSSRSRVINCRKNFPCRGNSCATTSSTPRRGKFCGTRYRKATSRAGTCCRTSGTRCRTRGGDIFGCMLKLPFFDPHKTYYENWQEGPFNGFADGVVIPPPQEARFSFFGHHINYPLGIPAGPLVNGKFVNAALDKGFDIPVHKTVRSKTPPCNEWKNVLAADIPGDLTLDMAQKPIVVTSEFKEPLSITNSFGNPSYEPAVCQKDLRECVAYAKPGQLVVCS